ncbi:MAG: hypothetical protein LUO93_04145 [Methanomicrobiales archaeon]|nr:hypothetical protein [Methanomicrobiales archaeon]
MSTSPNGLHPSFEAQHHQPIEHIQALFERFVLSVDQNAALSRNRNGETIPAQADSLCLSVVLQNVYREKC